MKFRIVTQILFIVYCVEAGALFLLTPWSSGWDRHVVQVPWLQLHELLLHPILRSAISAFGLLHLIWAAHDVDLLLIRWKRRAQTAAETDSHQ